MVVAEDSSQVGQGVFVQDAGGLVVAAEAVGGGYAVAGGEAVGVLVAKGGGPAGVQDTAQCPGGAGVPTGVQVVGGGQQQLTGVVADVDRGAVGMQGRGGQHLRGDDGPPWPAGRIPIAVGLVGGQQRPHGRGGALGEGGGLVGADDGRDETMQLDRVAVAPGQTVGEDRAEDVIEIRGGVGAGHHVMQRCVEQIGMITDQSQRDGLGAEVGAQVQHCHRGGAVGAQAVEGEGPDGVDGAAIDEIDPAGEHLSPSAAEFHQVIGGSQPGGVKIGGDLFQREGQVTEVVGKLVGNGGADAGDTPAQQGDRFAAG